MVNRNIRRGSALLTPCVGLIAVLMAAAGCETAKTDETPHLIMEQPGDPAIGQPEPSRQSDPSGPSVPR